MAGARPAGTAGRAIGQQRQPVHRLRVVAEHDDPGVGAPRPALVSRSDALVRPGRRHADVGDDDVVGLGFVDQREQVGKVPGRAGQLEPAVTFDQASQTLP